MGHPSTSTSSPKIYKLIYEWLNVLGDHLETTLRIKNFPSFFSKSGLTVFMS
jgi:hypothetical protein